MFRHVRNGMQGDNSIIRIEHLISSIFNDVMYNTVGAFQIEKITQVWNKIVDVYLAEDVNLRKYISDTIIERHLTLLTKILTICNVETTGYMSEMNIPQTIIAIYKNKNNIPKIPVFHNAKIPIIEDIVPDSSAYVEEFIRMFIILYKEYFYSDDVELELFKIPLYMSHQVDYMDKYIHNTVYAWFFKFIKGRANMNITDIYLVDIMYDFIMNTIFSKVDINWTNTYIAYSKEVAEEMMPYYFEASIDPFWMLDNLRYALNDAMRIVISNLLQEFYYNPLLIRLIIGTKMRMFYLYSKKTGRYYYEPTI